MMGRRGYAMLEMPCQSGYYWCQHERYYYFVQGVGSGKHWEHKNIIHSTQRKASQLESFCMFTLQILR